MFKTICKLCTLLLIIQLLGGCTASYYQQGRKSLEAENFDSAITSFEKALEEKPDDTQILRELGIAYYRNIQWDRAIPTLLQAFFQDSTDGRTLFYLGTAFEITKDYPHAIDTYRRYVDVSPLKDIRSTMEARLYKLVKQEIEKEIKASLAVEGAIDVQTIPENTVAVLYFKNMGKREDLNPIQKGLADMVITDLSKVQALTVVERLRIQKLMDEMGLADAGLVAESSAPRMGKLLGASRIVQGTFIDLSQNNLRMDAGLIQTKTGHSTVARRVQGRLDRFFQLEKDLVFNIIDDMGITLTQEEKDAIEIIPTENLLAFMAYCKGLDYEDRGLFDQARQQYNTAVGLDPNFQSANRNLSRAESYESANTDIAELEQMAMGSEVEEEPSSQEETPEEPQEEVAESDLEVDPLMSQMLHMGSVLNQNFLPGLDSRKPAQEQNQSSFGSTANFQITVPLPQQ